MMQTYTVRIVPSGIEFTVEPLETIVEAALRQNINYPYSCMQGTCTSCICKLRNGRVSYGDLPYIFTDEEKESGLTYACIAYPLSDLEIEIIYQDNE